MTVTSSIIGNVSITTITVTYDDGSVEGSGAQTNNDDDEVSSSSVGIIAGSVVAIIAIVCAIGAILFVSNYKLF